MGIGRNGLAPRMGRGQARRLAIVVAVVAGCAAAAAKANAREIVGFDAPGVPAGTIVVKTSERALYLVDGQGAALRYRVAVGQPSKQWFGWSQIDGKYVEPAWSPPYEVKRDNPRLPDLIPGGSPHNPMGPRALTLSGGEYAIHGTNKPSSIGSYASYGCIRMYNADIMDLYQRVRVGPRVVVVR